MKKIAFFAFFVLISTLSLHSQVFFSEVSPSNGTVKDMHSKTSDWIELSTDSSSVNIAGWRISDKPKISEAFTLPEKLITRDSPLLLFASGNSRSTEVVQELIGEVSWIGRWSSWKGIPSTTHTFLIILH